jgi:flagellar motor switch protein FliG
LLIPKFMATLTSTPDAPTATPLLTAPSLETPPEPLRVRGGRKVAILLTSVGDRISADIVRALTEEEVHDVTREISLLTDVSEPERYEVLNDFLKTSGKAAFFSPGGRDYATSILLTAFGPETGKRMADRLLKSMENDTSMIDTLRKADPQHLAKIVHREHPQTIALILCHIGSTQAASLLSVLPEELRAQVARRMAALDQISPEIINKLAKTICAKLRIVGEPSLETCGGVRAVAEVLNRVEVAAGEEILTAISAEDPTLGTTIRQLMFVFDDFLRLSQDILRTLVAAVDRKTLTIALKGSSPQLKKAFLGVLSTRAAEMVAEDIQALGPVRVRDVQAAQQTIIGDAKKLETQGLFSLHSSSLDEIVE